MDLALNNIQRLICYKIQTKNKHCGCEWTGEQLKLRGPPRFPKPQDWSHTIRLFSVTSRTLVAEVLSLCRDAVRVFYSPS